MPSLGISYNMAPGHLFSFISWYSPSHSLIRQIYIFVPVPMLFLPFSSSCSNASKLGPGSCSFIKIEFTWPKWNIPLIWHVSWKLFHCYFITRFPTVMTANKGNPSFTVLQTLWAHRCPAYMHQRPLGAGRAYGSRRLQKQSPLSLVTLLVHFGELIYLATHIIFILAESKTISAKSAKILKRKENFSSDHNLHPLTEGAVTQN